MAVRREDTELTPTEMLEHLILTKPISTHTPTS